MKLKRLTGCILALALLLTAVPCAALAAGSTPQHIPRIVYILYDNSGSMFDNAARWAYASYAMQSFCAMMDESDELHVLYLNGGGSEQKANLKSKQAEIEKFSKITYGGGTPNKVQEIADLLKIRYGQVGNGAQYFLLILADGELDDPHTTLEAQIHIAERSILETVPASNFTCEFFDMRKYEAAGADESEICENLRDISAKIMGRSEVPFKLSGSDLTFSIAYPAFSIVVFAQSPDLKTGSVSLTAKGPDGQTISKVNSYRVACPTSIVKTQNYKEIIPQDPPSGVISILKNDGAPLKKGEYKISLSGTNLKQQNVVVLIEPAVSIGCKYYVNDSTTPISFDELKDNLRKDMDLTIRCGLYEVNEDGSVGEEVPESVLKRDFSVYVNGEPLSDLRAGEKDAFRVKVDESMSGGELKVEALIEGFAPFVERQTLGEIRRRPVITHEPSTETVPVTLPDFREMTEGKRSLRFPFDEIDDRLLSEVSVESTSELFRSGACNALGGKVTLNDKVLEYDLTPASGAAFADLPDTVEIRLLIKGEDTPRMTYILQKQDSAYRIVVTNPFEKEPLSLSGIAKNDRAVSFELQADFDGSGNYVPYAPDGGVKFEFTAENGDLPGDTKTDGAVLLFTPKCDPAKIAALHKNSFSVKAKAEIDGETVRSEAAVITFSEATYRLAVKNEIAGPFTLDALKTNTGKILFTLTADYDGAGNYVPVEAWDAAVYDRLEVKSETLPGLTAQEKDAAGKVTGISFTPRYDEANPNGVVYTSVAGRTHTVTAALSGTEERAAAEVEVKAPVFTLETVEGMAALEIMDTDFVRNTEGFGFRVLRDGRPLSMEELEGLAPYTVTFEHDGFHKAETAADSMPDGGAYLRVTPKYRGWRIFNWITPLFMRHGKQTVTLTVGENSADAELDVTLNIIGLIICLVVAGLIIVSAWITSCILSRRRFIRGEFRRYTIKKNAHGYEVMSPLKAIRSYPLIKPLHCFKHCNPTWVVITVGDCSLRFRTKDKVRISTPIVEREYQKKDNGRVRICELDDDNWIYLLSKNHDFKFESGMMDPLVAEDFDPTLDYVDIHRGLIVPDKTAKDEYNLIIFISDKEAKRLRPQISRIN